jgi:hypothetical protein
MRIAWVGGAVFVLAAMVLKVPCSSAIAAESARTPGAPGRDRLAQEVTYRAVSVAPEEETVVLLDGGVPIGENDVVATLGTLLRSGGFRPEVVAEVESRYFGYMIDRQKRDGRWELVGPLQAFTGRYGSRYTTGWPDRTSFLYEDSRANAASVAWILPTGNVAETANMRIYYRPDRVGFDGGRYQTRDVLMIVYLDPETGHQSTYAFRREGDGYELYRYAAPEVPSRPTDASLVSIMGVATTDTIRIQVFIASVSVPVPRHTYSARMFRVFGGRNYDGTATPMGPPIRFAGLSQEEGAAPFAAALKAHQEGRPLTDKEFADVYRFIRHVHRYLVEKPVAAK